MTKEAVTAEPREKPGDLSRLAASPAIWALHFLLSYGTAAVWCAKAEGPAEPLTPVRVAIALYTVAALAAILLLGWGGWRRHRLPGGSLPHDADTPADRHRFLGFATLLLSGLSAVAVLYAALTVAFLGDCR